MKGLFKSASLLRFFRRNIHNNNRNNSIKSLVKHTSNKNFVGGTSLVLLGSLGVFSSKDESSTNNTSVQLNETDTLSRISRPLTFWVKMFPIFLDYKYTQFMMDETLTDEQQDQIYESLHQKYAKGVLNLILSLRGIYIKFGQVGAMRADIFPKTYRDEFKQLLDAVPALDEFVAKSIVKEALNKNSLEFDEVFSDFESFAIGAASIGQVHRATLKDGTKVVVKIKYPDSHILFSQDFETFRQFAVLASPEQLPAMNELRSQFLKEFDFGREAWALNTIRKNIMPYFKNVVIPKPYLEYCNDDIIVMEYLPGQRLLNGVLDNYRLYAKRMGTTVEEMMERKGSYSMWEKATMGSRYIGFAFLDQIHYACALLFNYTVGFFGPQLTYPTRLIDQKRIYKTLLEVHGHEILIDRVFQGDPHLGNVLLMPDGRLGLIDYGQVKAFSKRDARNYAIMLKLLKKKDMEAVVVHAKNMGFSTEKNDDYVLWKTCQVIMDSDSREVCGGQNLQQFMEAMSKRDKTKTIPEQFVFASRSAILLRGIGMLMGFDSVSLAKEWEHLADRAIELFPEGASDDDDVFDYQ